MPRNGVLLVAVDTNILYGDSWGVAHHRKALQALHRLKCEPVVLPTSFEEIDVAAVRGTEGMKMLTHVVKQNLADCDHICYSEVMETYAEIIEKCAAAMMESGCLPGAEKNDARIVVEACYFECDELMTTRASILNGNKSVMVAVLKEFGFGFLKKIFSPKIFAV